jgi:hypothetical protein
MRIWQDVIVESVRLHSHQNCEEPIAYRSAGPLQREHAVRLFVCDCVMDGHWRSFLASLVLVDLVLVRRVSSVEQVERERCTSVR